MTLTARQKLIIRAALGYAQSNIDDINDAFAGERGEDGTDAISVGGIVGLPLEEGEVQAFIDLFESPTRTTTAGLRAFKGTFLVVIDPSEADEDEQPLTLDVVSGYLKETLVLDIDTEEHGNPVGFQSAELLFDTLEELSPDTVWLLYGV